MSSAMDKLMSAVNKAKTGGTSERENDYFYYPNRDAAGNASAVIRFLPAASDDVVPFIKMFSHGFQGPGGKWLIDNCPTTLEQECPVCTSNSALWNTGLESDKTIARARKRRVSYVARVVVVEDKKSPDNEGQVFMFKFGQRIFDKIADALQPEFDDDKPCNIFDLAEGANFKLKIRKVDGQTNYDKSEFDSPSECGIKVEKQYTEANDPQKFIDPKNYKSAADLQKRLDFVLGKSPTTQRAAPKADDDGDDDFPDVPDNSTPAPAKTKRVETPAPSEEEDDEVMALMRSLADD